MGSELKLEFEYLWDRPKDVPLVIAWWRTVWGDRMGDNLENLEEQLRSSLSKTELPIHILATLGGIPVGTAALKQHELTEVFPDCSYWLGSVFVEEGVRGGQIASKMTLHMIEMAKRLHLPHLYLQTINLNGGLYSKLGWESVTEFTHVDEHALLMLRML